MRNLKALGSDDYYSIFFQKYWDIVGGDFCHFFKGVFHNHQTIKEVNKTFITFIPKKEEVVFIKDFRPISMCNVTYKVITKLIAQRIRSIVSKLVVALFLLVTLEIILW